MGIDIPATGGLSDLEIELAEKQLGCQLPTAWREFARQHDGAVPQDNLFQTTDNESGVRCFVPLLQAASLRQEIDGFPSQGVPMAEDGSGNYVWGDPATGAIFFWDHENDEPTVAIAPDLGSFLSSLQPFDPASVQLAPGQVKSAWIDPDFFASLKKS
ncbi:SMI1/KNR4 family protein [Phenylobacterium sp. LjRoot225]|uniref:SMI1/KNR4 family protein n=1 Tax=Phenylobacterium sp. LjRoot225 TaxID=3342285 RepID=UPI003ECE68E9